MITPPKSPVELRELATEIREQSHFKDSSVETQLTKYVSLGWISHADASVIRSILAVA